MKIRETSRTLLKIQMNPTIPMNRMTLTSHGMKNGKTVMAMAFLMKLKKNLALIPTRAIRMETD